MPSVGMETTIFLLHNYLYLLLTPWNIDELAVSAQQFRRSANQVRKVSKSCFASVSCNKADRWLRVEYVVSLINHLPESSVSLFNDTKVERHEGMY